MRRSVHFHRGGIYHIFNRGANRNSIFVEEDNYIYVLRKMRRYSEMYDIAIVAYVLQPNHYHFLLHQNGEESARKLPQYTFNAYTKAFNKRYGHSGTLFQGPFRAIEVTTEPYLLNLIRYIHANPVLHGLVDDPGQWAFSNYLEWVGERNGALVDRDFVSTYFDSPAAYRAFVLEYLRERELPQPLAEYLQTVED
jgi:REP element-mobilizing transposase RayT